VAADAYYKQALGLEGQDRRADSIALYQMALRLVPNEDFYYLRLGGALIELAKGRPKGEPDQSFRAEPRAVLAMPTQRLTSLGQQQMMQAAEAILQEARRLAPINPDHYANLARLNRVWSDLGEPGRLPQSLEYYEQVLKVSPFNTSLFAEYGTVYLAQGNNPKAIEVLSRGIVIEPEYHYTLHRELRADAYLASGNVDEAVKDYRAAIFYNPKALASGNVDGRIDGIARIGRIDAVTDEFHSIITRFERAQTWSAHNMLGFIYARQNRPAEALPHFKAATEILTEVEQQTKQKEPTHWLIRRNLAIVYSQLGQREQARQEVTAALALAPAKDKGALQTLMNQLGGS
ncbi:MAG: tetratricopeptide repeat protein, partial [Chloroflexi bacterium]|nr:tetratricopeptide repeat protein [Chloroflexota bacterium]